MGWISRKPNTAIATNVGVGSYTIVVMDLSTGDVASAQVAFTGPTIIDIFPILSINSTNLF